jgi:hypothetical protein
LAATKRQQEEGAAKKKLEEEAAAKKKEEEAAAAGSVVFDGLTIDVENSGNAQVKLTCSDVENCAGKLTLRVKGGTTKKGKASKTKTTTIGTATFSIAPGKTATVQLTLSVVGRALLKADHGRLSASLTVLKSLPAPVQTHGENVQLVLQKAPKRGSHEAAASPCARLCSR